MILSWILTLIYGAAFAFGAIAVIMARSTIDAARGRYDAIGEERRAAWKITWSVIFLKPLVRILLQGGLLLVFFMLAISVLFRDLTNAQSIVAAVLAITGMLAFFGNYAFRYWRGERLHPKEVKWTSLRVAQRSALAMPALLAAGAALDFLFS